MFKFVISVTKADSTGYYYAKYVKDVEVIAATEAKAKEKAKTVLGPCREGVYDRWRLKVKSFEEVAEPVRTSKTYEIGYKEGAGVDKVSTAQYEANSAAEAVSLFMRERAIYFIILSVEAVN